MECENRLDEFIELEEYLNKTKVIYLYGCIPAAGPLIEQTEWIIKKCYGDNTIIFVDRSLQKQKTGYLEKEVISPEVFRQGIERNNGIVVVLPDGQAGKEIWEGLCSWGIKRKLQAYNIYDFNRIMSIMIYSQYHKVYFHFCDLFLQTNCNLNCCDCFVQTYRNVRLTIDERQLKENIDLLFKKIDYIGIIVFGIAEGFWDTRQLEFALKYTTEKYSNKFMIIEITTNGTIVPEESLLEVLKQSRVRIVVDDYRENVVLAQKNYLKVIQTLKKNNIACSSLKRDHWDKTFFGTEEIRETREELRDKYKNCCNHAKGFPYVGYKAGTARLFPCVFQTINAYLGLIEEKESDSIDLEISNSVDVIKFVLGYTERGYLSACKYCQGIFEGVEVNHIPVAVQKESET